METEITVNGKNLIPLTETKKIMKHRNETEKFYMETPLYFHFTPSCRFYAT